MAWEIPNAYYGIFTLQGTDTVTAPRMGLRSLGSNQNCTNIHMGRR